ncbi:MAG: sarcosine oxidase subunit delta [Ectothiorhodospiraceae bacterium]|nr:sarcosine oxidase subunit delta [Ectothiorhodospiraceae bacterium]
MLRIPCPFCGPRDHAEFSYEGDATVAYPPLDASREDWFEAVFLRANPCGAHREMWHHVQGCRAFVVVERDTLTHEIKGARLAHRPTAEAIQ